MRAFLLSVIAVLGIAITTNLLFNAFLAKNAGDVFSRPPSTRLSADYRPEPGGRLSNAD